MKLNLVFSFAITLLAANPASTYAMRLSTLLKNSLIALPLLSGYVAPVDKTISATDVHQYATVLLCQKVVLVFLLKNYEHSVLLRAPIKLENWWRIMLLNHMLQSSCSS